MGFDSLWDALLPVGRHAATGGYRRFTWSPAEQECREWFVAEAVRRGLDVRVDRNANLWAWWGDPAAGGCVVAGSHLDSVPDGGAYDGPLGVISAFAAVDALRAEGFSPARPIGVAAFTEEEGARFGVACLGSGLAVGAVDPERARGLRDSSGQTLAEAMRRAGHDPYLIGFDADVVDRIGVFVELHIEQGRALVACGRPVGVARSIWPHGRWRFEFSGEANHAGTTPLADRHDPMLLYAKTVLDARSLAWSCGALATFGRVVVSPNGTNAIPGRVTGWLDARAPSESSVRRLVDSLTQASSAEVSEESWTPVVDFDTSLRDRVCRLLDDAPVLATGAGHDAGVLAGAGVPTVMLFVRNPTGISHAPAEEASRDDCLAGISALTAVLEDLAG